MHLAQIMD